VNGLVALFDIPPKSSPFRETGLPQTDSEALARLFKLAGSNFTRHRGNFSQSMPSKGFRTARGLVKASSRIPSPRENFCSLQSC
jgi:hypothetical protein